MRMPFNQVFNVKVDGSISPRATVQLGSLQIGPGVPVGRGVAFGGVELAAFAGRDLDVDVVNGVHVIKGIL